MTTEGKKRSSFGRWTAQQMIEIWARGLRDELPDPVAELRRMSGLGGDAIRNTLITAAVSRYVTESPGFPVARPALVYRYVEGHGEDWSRFPLRGHGETLLKAALALGWADLLHIRPERMAMVVEMRFWWQLTFRLQDDPPQGDLAALFASIDYYDAQQGPCTPGERQQWRLIVGIRRAQLRGDTERVRVLVARLSAARGSNESCGSYSKNRQMGQNLGSAMG